MVTKVKLANSWHKNPAMKAREEWMTGLKDESQKNETERKDKQKQKVEQHTSLMFSKLRMFAQFANTKGERMRRDVSDELLL